MSFISEFLTVHEDPPGQFEHLIMAMGGWPDAAEAATTTAKYMLRKLGAKKFAEIDPEDFYVFTQERPRSSRTRDGRRRVHWPANEFHYWPGNESSKAVMFFLGLEPNLKWRTFSRIVSDLAQEYRVKSVIHIGALLDAVPHSREIRLTGSSTAIDLQKVLDTSRVSTSRYQGPTGITSAISEACTNQGDGVRLPMGPHLPLLAGSPQLPGESYPGRCSYQIAGLAPGLGRTGHRRINVR